MTASTGTDPAQPGGVRLARRGDSPALVISAVILFLVSITLLAVVMALGPSAGVPRIGPGAPIWSLSARPSPAVVITLERTGLLLGALAVAIGIAAVGRGWRPSARLLVGAAAATAALFVILPPAGSIDVLNYAIYGRIAGLGHNPYLMRPAQLQRSGDPVGFFAPTNWRTLPTIYGPVATAVQWAAAKLGGASMARIVFWIRLGNGIAFVVTAVGLIRLAGRDRARQARACLLWAVNPLMLFWLVGSGHVDVLLALLAVASLIMIRSRRCSGIIAGAVTGLIVGAATAIKTPFALVGLGMAWAARKSPRIIVAGLVGAAAVLIPSYLLPGVLNTAVLSRRLTVSAGFIYPVPAAIRSRPAVFAAMVLLATLALALLLLWRLPPGHPALPAVRPAAALALGWLVIFPVQAPWYDALIFPLLALMPASWLDYLLIARCLLLSEMLLPGVQPDTGALSVNVARFSHLGVLFLLGVLIVMCLLRAWGGVGPDGGELRLCQPVIGARAGRAP
jgi:alpha-1,6-mannosyltransferase